MNKAPADIRPEPLPKYRRRFPQQELLEGAQLLLRAYNRAVSHFSAHGSRVFYNPAEFPWIRSVEESWRTLRTELDAVMQQPDRIPQFADISPDQQHLTHPSRWKTFFLLAYGVRVEENCLRCPGTARAIENIPGVQTAFFSILQPGTHICPHRGPFGGVLRYHLALLVPEPETGCRIRVDHEIATWKEGHSIVFDDTYEHEVWNDTNGLRAVLFVDFERPLPQPLAAINRSLIRMVARSAFVQEAIRRYEEWTSRDAAARGSSGRGD